MGNILAQFEKIVRSAAGFSEPEEEIISLLHPFESRDIHSKFPAIVLNLFDDGHYAQSTFEAYKFTDKVVQQISGESEAGFKLMMKVFQVSNSQIKLTQCQTTSEIDEQKGYQFLFAGSMMAIRNPRGHESALRDDPDTCLDHLSFASLLLRRIEKAGYTISSPETS